MIHFLMLLFGLVPLIWGANMLVNGATSIADHYKIPNVLIGLTIVAVGTSSPELAVNVFSSYNHSDYITVGNVMGSNIFNIAAILGITALIFPLQVTRITTWKDVPLNFLAGLLVLVAANDHFFYKNDIAVISRIDGAFLMLLFLIFIVYIIKKLKNGHVDPELNPRNYSKAKSWMLIFMGLAMLAAGGQLMVYSAENFAEYLGITERIIAIGIVAVGTSLPELVTFIVAARKKKVEMAVGSLVGSNIFNVFFILGISALINPIAIGQSINEDLIFNVFISLLLFVFIFTGKGRMIDRTEGGIFVMLYVFYMCYILFMM